MIAGSMPDRFVAFNERAVLQGAGRVSHTRMEQVAHLYDAFDAKRRAAETEAAERAALADLEQIEEDGTAAGAAVTRPSAFRPKSNPRPPLLFSIRPPKPLVLNPCED